MQKESLEGVQQPTISSWEAGGLCHWMSHILPQMSFIVQEDILMASHIILNTTLASVSFVIHEDILTVSDIILNMRFSLVNA